MVDGVDEVRLVFRTPLATRIGDTFLALLLGLAAFPIALMVPAGFAFALTVIRCPMWLAIPCGLVLTVFFLRIAWGTVAERLRFCVVFHLTHLQIGRGPFRLSLPYDDVDEVALPTVIDDGYWIGIRAGKKAAAVFLRPDDLGKCFLMLGHLCQYAVRTDAAGKEHPPVKSDNPDRYLLNRQRYHVRCLVGALVALPGLSLECLIHAMPLCQRCQGIAVPNGEVSRNAALFVVFGVATIGALYAAWVSAKTVVEIRRQRFAIADEVASERWRSVEESGEVPPEASEETTER